MAVAVAVFVRVGVAVGVLVRVAVAVGVLVRVGVDVGVLVRVAVAVGVLVRVGVGDGVLVEGGVPVAVGVVVAVAVALGEGVGVGVGADTTIGATSIAGTTSTLVVVAVARFRYVPGVLETVTPKCRVTLPFAGTGMKSHQVSVLPATSGLNDMSPVVLPGTYANPIGSSSSIPVSVTPNELGLWTVISYPFVAPGATVGRSAVLVTPAPLQCVQSS